MTPAERARELERLAARTTRNIVRRRLAIEITGGIEAPGTGPRMLSYALDHPEVHAEQATQPHPDDRE